MISSLNIFILFIEIIGFIVLLRRLGVLHVLTIFYAIALVYAQAYLLDHLLFFKPSVLHPIDGLNLKLDVFSWTYLKMQGIHLLFFIVYFLASLSCRETLPLSGSREDKAIPNQRLFYYVFMGVCTAWMMYIVASQTGMTRLERGALQTPATLIINNVIAYSWLIVTLNFKDKGIFYSIYTASVITAFVFSFEREPLLIVFITLIFYYRDKLNVVWLALGSAICIVLLAYWKALYFAFFYSSGLGLYQLAWHYQKFGFSLAGMDPVGSNVLLYDYLLNGSIYDQYRYSYVTNFYEQFYRMIYPSDYQTLAEFASEHYAQSQFGLAFSMMLESLINLKLFGPAVLGLIIPYTFRFLYKFSRQYGPAIVVASLIVAVKFIRTELATLVKLQLIPLSIAFILVVIIIQKLKVREFPKSVDYLYTDLQSG